MKNNNNEQFDSFIRDFESIRMTPLEKKDMQKRLEIFTAQHPKTISPYFSYASLFKKTLAFALVLLLLVSASKQASAKALPGDFLYHIKIIHEDIEEASIREPSKKINFEIKRAEKRIQEAVELAKEKKLEPSTQKKIVHNIKEHVQDVNKKIQEIQKESPEKALVLNTQLKTTLKVNSELLKKTIEETAQKDSDKETHDKIKNTDNHNTGDNNSEGNKQDRDVVLDSAENKHDEELTPADNTSSKSHDKNINENEKNDVAEEENTNNDDIQDTKQIQEKTTETQEQNILDKEEGNQDIVEGKEETPQAENTHAENSVTEEKQKSLINEETKKSEQETYKEKEVEQVFDFDTDILLSSIDDTIKIAEKNENRIKQEIIEKETPQTKEEKNNKGGNKGKNDTSLSQTEQTERDTADAEKENNGENTSTEQEANEDFTSTSSETTQESNEQEKTTTENTELITTTPEEYIVETPESEETRIKKDIDKTKALLNADDSLEKLKLKITSLKYIVEAEEKLEGLLAELGVERDMFQVEKIQSLIDAKKFGQAYIELEKEIEPLLELKLQRKFGIELNQEDKIDKTLTATPKILNDNSLIIQENEA